MLPVFRSSSVLKIRSPVWLVCGPLKYVHLNMFSHKLHGTASYVPCTELERSASRLLRMLAPPGPSRIKRSSSISRSHQLAV